MTSPTKPTSTTSLVPLRGESGKCYGYFDPRTGVLHVRKGHAVDRVDLGRQVGPYLAIAKEGKA